MARATGMYLVGCVYNRFACRYHDSLAVELALPRGRGWLQRTPAIVAKLTDHRWSVFELLSFRVPPPVWQPPKRRGRPPKAVLEAHAAWRWLPRLDAELPELVMTQVNPLFNRVPLSEAAT